MADGEFDFSLFNRPELRQFPESQEDPSCSFAETDSALLNSPFIAVTGPEDVQELQTYVDHYRRLQNECGADQNIRGPYSIPADIRGLATVSESPGSSSADPDNPHFMGAIQAMGLYAGLRSAAVVASAEGAGAFFIGYEIGTVIDKKWGISNWIAGVKSDPMPEDAPERYRHGGFSYERW